MTSVILLVLALYMAQLFLQETSRFGLSLRVIMGNRDHPPEMTLVAGRLDRAKGNMQEALPIFLSLALLALIRGGDISESTHGAILFLIARIIYVPAYVSGIPMLRSIVWLVGVAGLVMMALPLIQ